MAEYIENSEVEFWEKRMSTFIAVRDRLKETGNAWVYNMCFHTPWRFYATHSVDECVEILLAQYTWKEER